MNNIIKAKYIGKNNHLCTITSHSLFLTYDKNVIYIYVNNMKMVYESFLDFLKDWSNITMIGHYSINRSNITKK